MAPKLSSKQWALSLTILAMLLALSLHQFFQITSNQLTLSFLDVGQGDAILIQTPEYKNILIDAGADGKVVEELSQKLGFFNQKIDLFILTHPDLDHYGGIMDAFQKYPIEQLMITGIAGKSQIYSAFIRELKVREAPLIYPESSKDIQISQRAYLDILYPFEGQSLIGQEVKNKNDTSISLIIRDGAGKPLALLTGDGEGDQEVELLLSGQDLQAPIFKLGHHGSKTSNTDGILSAANAKVFVVSAGKDNKFGHPHEEVMAKLDQKLVRSTAEEGSITFVLE